MIKMAKIHGFFYLVIGVGIALISENFNRAQETLSFRLFTYIGILMGLVGLVKLLFKGFKKERVSAKHPKPTIRHDVRFCSRCGGALAAGAQYCPYCGNRL